MEYFVYIYLFIVLLCIVEAVLYTEWDSESKEELKNREKIIKDEHKSTS